MLCALWPGAFDDPWRETDMLGNAATVLSVCARKVIDPLSDI